MICGFTVRMKDKKRKEKKVETRFDDIYSVEDKAEGKVSFSYKDLVLLASYIPQKNYVRDLWHF